MMLSVTVSVPLTIGLTECDLVIVNRLRDAVGEALLSVDDRRTVIVWVVKTVSVAVATKRIVDVKLKKLAVWDGDAGTDRVAVASGDIDFEPRVRDSADAVTSWVNVGVPDDVQAVEAEPGLRDAEHIADRV